jgi:hypothetical protein
MEDQKSRVGKDGRIVCSICGEVLGQGDLANPKESMVDHCRTPNCPNNPDTKVGANH